MKTSDTLRAKRADLLDRMTALSEKAEREARLFTPDEERAFDAARAEVADIDAKLERTLAAEALVRDGARHPVGRVAIDSEGNQRRILAPQERLFDRYAERVHPEFAEQASLGAAIRGLVTGQWGGRDLLQRALSEGSSTAGGVTVPNVLSALWLDMVRAQSVMTAAGTGVLTMPNGNMTIAGLASDPVPTSKKENTPFPDSNPTFRPVTMKAKTYGVVVTSSVELLSDSPNAEAMVEASLVGAMAGTFDTAAIAGDGSTAANLDNVLGVLSYGGIPETATVGTPADYDAWLDAMAAMDALNFTARTVIDNPATTNFLRKLPTGLTGDKTKLAMPVDYAALQRLKSAHVPAGNSVVGDFSRGTYGIAETLTIEATRQGGSNFQNYSVGIRAVLRFDWVPLYVNGFHRMKGITTVAGAAAMKRAA